MIWAVKVQNLHAASLMRVGLGPNAQFLRGLECARIQVESVLEAFKANALTYAFYQRRLRHEPGLVCPFTVVEGEGEVPFWSVIAPPGGGGGMDAAGRVMAEKYV